LSSCYFLSIFYIYTIIVAILQMRNRTYTAISTELKLSTVDEKTKSY